MDCSAINVRGSNILQLDVTPVYATDLSLWLERPTRGVSADAVVQRLPVAICELANELGAWADVGTSVSFVPTWIIDLLGSLYAFTHPEEVSWFIRNAPHLLPSLLQAPVEIRKYFPHSLLRLEVFVDPEEYVDQRLTLYIVTSMAVDQGLEALDRLDRDWWLEAASMAMAGLSINLEFIDEF